MMPAAVQWAGVIVCLAVLVSCICRVNQLKAGRHHPGWGALYIAWATSALGVALDLVLRPDDVAWWVGLAIGAIMLQLWLTRNDWARGAPENLVTCKERP
jgi:hypothetical protein